MDIKIIPCKKGTESHCIDDYHILMINKVSASPDETMANFPFNRVEYSIYNTKTRVLENILPDLTKYQIGNLCFASRHSNIIYFVHLEFPCFPMATFMLFSYDIESNICREVYRFEDNLQNYVNEKSLSLYILNNQYILVQYTNVKTNAETQISYNSFLYDTKNKLSYEIIDERFSKQGIQQFIPIANNVCALRFGRNQIDNNSLIAREKSECSKETICLISISQFIADVLLKIKIISSEIIDEVYFDKTFSDIRRAGKYLLFSRIDRNDGSQEIYFYQYITKDTHMLINTNSYNPDKIFPCVLNNKALLVRTHKKNYEFYDIKSKKVVYHMPVSERIEFCEADYLVVNKEKKLFRKKGEEQVLIIKQYSSQKILYKEALKPIKYSLINKDSLVILVEE